ncbi:MAG: hypothetical protein IPL84_12435 [Chitinophagaceae bacterium]|nr:hypothetical protein [Chitinophagaceae bacterium]
MKKMNLIIPVKNIFLGIFAATLIFAYTSCAKKTAAVAKTETPAETIAAENKGQVQIKRDANSNYVIQINLRELEAVKGIDPATKKAYIVWMNADGQKAANLGQINSNTGWLTDKSKASFEATSVFKPTKVFITEEDVALAKKPGSKVIWTTSTF